MKKAVLFILLIILSNSTFAATASSSVGAVIVANPAHIQLDKETQSVNLKSESNLSVSIDDNTFSTSIDGVLALGVTGGTISFE